MLLYLPLQFLSDLLRLLSQFFLNTLAYEALQSLAIILKIKYCFSSY